MQASVHGRRDPCMTIVTLNSPAVIQRRQLVVWTAAAIKTVQFIHTGSEFHRDFYIYTRPYGVTPKERVIRKMYTQYLSDDVNHQTASTCTYFHRQETSSLMDGITLRRPLHVHTFTYTGLLSVWQMALIIWRLWHAHTFTHKNLVFADTQTPSTLLVDFTRRLPQ